MNMYKRKTIFEILALSALLLSAGCERLEQDHTGRSITFRAASEWQNEVETKTIYSGVTANGKERIDWVDGDKIRIRSDKAKTLSDKNFADYKVVSHEASNEKSKATIEPDSEANGLQWGTGTHAFYCLYPSPTVNDDIKFTSANATQAVAQETILTVQGYTLDGTTLKPNMNYAYMYAATSADPSSSTVELSFKPMFTAFQFDVDSGLDATLTLKSFTLSSAGIAMSGTCKATITSAGGVSYSDFPAATAANNKVTVTFSPEVTITKNTPIRFTVFALPQDYDELSISFTTTSGDIKTLELKQSGSFMSFSAGHKYNITNMKIPGQWTYELSTLSDIEMDFLGGSKVFDDFKSLRKKSDDSKKEALAYTVQYSEDGTTWEDYDKTNNYFPSAEWLHVTSESNFTGSTTGEKLTFTIDPQTARDMGTLDLRTISQEEEDLSTYNVATGKKVARSTANCYVVDAAGTFRFPAVYGNALLHGLPNEAAYHRTRPLVSGGDANFLGYFKDHADQDITQPYIAKQQSVKDAGGLGDAQLVWEDWKEGDKHLITNVELDMTHYDIPYIKFTVPSDAHHQGNAMIALRAADNTIVWSWHIWVYVDKEGSGNNRNLSKPIDSPNGYKFSPVNLGWRDVSEIFDGRPSYTTTGSTTVTNPGYIRIVQTGREPGPVTEVKQLYSEKQFGQAPYFAWGRKDPIRGFTNLTNENHELFYNSAVPAAAGDTFNGSFGMYASSGNKTIGWTIQHPYCFIYYTTEYSWISGNDYLNLWNASYLGQDDVVAVTKTIYDPCPVGYKVPPQFAFEPFTNAIAGSPDTPDPKPTSLKKVNESSSTHYYGEFWRYYDADFDNNADPEELFFPAAGFRNSAGGANATKLSNVGQTGYYWTSHKRGAVQNSRQYDSANDLFMMNTIKLEQHTRAHGRSVRPIVDAQANFDVDGGSAGGQIIDVITVDDNWN